MTLTTASTRAELLASQSNSARDPLLFAAHLVRLWSAAAMPPLSGRFADDVQVVLPIAQDILRGIAEKAPDALVQQALARLDDDPDTATTRLTLYWNGETTTREDYLSRAILRPYAQALRERGIAPERAHNPGHCPFCGGKPIVSTRRALADAEAGLRMLHCALCALEWNFNRGSCPSCAEEKPDNLPVYSSDAHPNVRIEACDTCRRYVKSIDVTKDPRPIAEIDDLLSIAMDLWAAEQGYTRIEPGWAGI